MPDQTIAEGAWKVFVEIQNPVSIRMVPWQCRSHVKFMLVWSSSCMSMLNSQGRQTWKLVLNEDVSVMKATPFTFTDVDMDFNGRIVFIDVISASIYYISRESQDEKKPIIILMTDKIVLMQPHCLVVNLSQKENTIFIGDDSKSIHRMDWSGHRHEEYATNMTLPSGSVAHEMRDQLLRYPHYMACDEVTGHLYVIDSCSRDSSIRSIDPVTRKTRLLYEVNGKEDSLNYLCLDQAPSTQLDIPLLLALQSPLNKWPLDIICIVETYLRHINPARGLFAHTVLGQLLWIPV